MRYKIILGLFLGCVSNVNADDCGVINLLADRSSGVSVNGNSCNPTNNIALGSQIDLIPGARLWFQLPQGESNKVQAICQNRSSKPVHLTVNSKESPWIKVSEDTYCSEWKENKLNCDDHAGDQKGLNCVISTTAKQKSPVGMDERTTSVLMRSISDPADDSDKTGSDTWNSDQIVAALNPDVNLCKTINSGVTHYKLSWRVETNRQVTLVNSVADNANHTASEVDKNYLECVTAVIKSFDYPQPSQATWLSSQF